MEELTKITIKTESGELTRHYNWEADGNTEDKGVAVEEMLSVLKKSNEHNL